MGERASEPWSTPPTFTREASSFSTPLTSPLAHTSSHSHSALNESSESPFASLTVSSPVFLEHHWSAARRLPLPTKDEHVNVFVSREHEADEEDQGEIFLQDSRDAEEYSTLESRNTDEEEGAHNEGGWTHDTDTLHTSSSSSSSHLRTIRGPEVSGRHGNPLDYFAGDPDFQHEYNLSFGMTPPASDHKIRHGKHSRFKELDMHSMTRFGGSSTVKSGGSAKKKGHAKNPEKIEMSAKSKPSSQSKKKQYNGKQKPKSRTHQDALDIKVEQNLTPLLNATSDNIKTGFTVKLSVSPKERENLGLPGGPLSRLGSASSILAPRSEKEIQERGRLQALLSSFNRKRTTASFSSTLDSANAESDKSQHNRYEHHLTGEWRTCTACKAFNEELWRELRNHPYQDSKRILPEEAARYLNDEEGLKKSVNEFVAMVRRYKSDFRSSSFTFTGHNERLKILEKVDEKLEMWSNMIDCVPTSAHLAALIDQKMSVEFVEDMAALQTWSKYTRHFMTATEKLNKIFNTPTYSEACHLWNAHLVHVSHKRSTGSFTFEDARHTISEGATLNRGETYIFCVNAPGHSLVFRSEGASPGASAQPYPFAVNNERSVGYILLTLPPNCPDKIQYRCATHANCKRGFFNVKKAGTSSSKSDAFDMLKGDVIMREHAVHDTLNAVEKIAWGACQLFLPSEAASQPPSLSPLAHQFPVKAGLWAQELLDHRDRACTKNLPSWLPLYLYTAYIPLGVMNSILGQIGELFGSSNPSSIASAEFCLEKYREVLREATRVKTGFLELFSALDEEMPMESPFHQWLSFSLDWFDRRLSVTFEAYLRLNTCLFNLVTEDFSLPKRPESNIAASFKFGSLAAAAKKDITFDLTEAVSNLLEEEWRRAKVIATHVDSGEELVASSFCGLASKFLEYAMYAINQVRDSVLSNSHGAELRNDLIFIKRTVMKVLGFAKQLRKDIEVAAEFSTYMGVDELISSLDAAGYKQILLPGDVQDVSVPFENALVFCPKAYATQKSEHLLLNLLYQSLSWGPEHFSSRNNTLNDDLYLIMVPLAGLVSGPPSRQVSGRSDASVDSGETMFAYSPPPSSLHSSSSEDRHSSASSASRHRKSSNSTATPKSAISASVSTSARFERAFSFSEQSQDEARRSWKLMRGRSPQVARALLAKAMDSFEGTQKSGAARTLSGSSSNQGDDPMRILVVSSQSQLLASHRERFQKAFEDAHPEMLVSLCESTSWKLSISENLARFRQQADALAEAIVVAVESLKKQCEQAILSGNINNVMRSAFQLAFEFLPELLRYNPSNTLRLCVLDVGLLWSEFVVKIPDPGAGSPPSWAKQGVDYLIAASDETTTNALSSEGFKRFMLATRTCIEHLCKRRLPSETGEGVGAKTEGLLSPPPTPYGAASTPSALTRGANVPSSAAQSQPLEPRTATGMVLVNRYGGGAEAPEDQKSERDDGLPPISCSELDKILSLGYYRSRFSAKFLARAKDGQQPDAPFEVSVVGRVLELDERKGSAEVQQGNTVPFRWYLGRRLGQGTFGVVYTAMRSKMQRNEPNEVMAVKICQWPSNDEERKAALVAMKNEWGTVTNVRSPHLVQYLGIEYRMDRCLVFMEYCSGGSLRAFSEKHELPLSEVRRFTKQIVLGVKALHDANIIHRDLKGDNILLDGNLNAKVGDFGSCIRGESAVCLGTIPFTAPEVFSVSKEGADPSLTRKRDVWAIGAVVCEMMTGRIPFQDRIKGSGEEFCNQIMALYFRNRFSIIDIHPTIPKRATKDCEEFLLRCFTRDVSARPQAAQLLQEPFLMHYQTPSAGVNCPCGCS